MFPTVPIELKRGVEELKFTLNADLVKSFDVFGDSIYLEQPNYLKTSLLVFSDRYPMPVCDLRYTRFVRTTVFRRLTFKWETATDEEVVVRVGGVFSILSLENPLGGIGILDSLDNRINPAKEDGNLANLDILMSQQGYNVVQRYDEATYGIDALWSSSGTPIDPGATKIPLNISGKGRLAFARLQTDYNAMFIKIYLDAEYINAGGYDRPIFIWDTFGGTGKFGFVDFLIYDTVNNKYLVNYHVFEVGEGRFGASVKIDIHNPDGVEHNAYSRGNYFVLSSREYRVKDSPSFEPDRLRLAIAKRAGLSWEALTVVYVENWDERENRNVPTLSVMQHRKKDENLDNAIYKELKEVLGIEKRQVEEVEF